MDNRTYEAVIQFIKSEILAGRLKPGEKLLPERELAQKLSISRTSIREALRTMEVLGVVESIQGAGNFISVNFEKNMTEAVSMMFLLRQTDGRQLSDIREALEMKAAELAVNHITDEQICELESIVSVMSETNDEEKAAELDKRLHYTIASVSQNIILIQILNAMSALIDDFINGIRYNILKDNENRARLLDIHKKMVCGLKERNLGVVQDAFRQHTLIINEYIGQIN